MKFFIILIGVMALSCGKDTEVWKSNCNNKYVLRLEEKDNKMKAFFYGSLNNEGINLNYESSSDDVSYNGSKISFKLDIFHFSNDSLFETGNKNLFKRPDLEFMLPNIVKGSFDSENKILDTKIFIKTSYSNFEECTFYLNES